MANPIIHTDKKHFASEIRAQFNDLFVGGNERVTCKSATAAKQIFRDAFVFGHLVLEAPYNTTFSFRRIFVLGGRIECQGGVKLRATRIVQMTLEQFLLGSDRMKEVQDSPMPIKSDQFLTLLPNEGLNDNINLRYLLDKKKGQVSEVTGLIWATYCEDAQLVALYIRAGADLDACKPWSALNWAVRQKHPEIIKMLVKAGAEVKSILPDLVKYRLNYTMNNFCQILEECDRTEHKTFLPSPVPSASSVAPHIYYRPLRFTQKELDSFQVSNKSDAEQAIKDTIDEITQALSLRQLQLTSRDLKHVKQIPLNIYIAPYTTSALVSTALRCLSEQIKRLSPK